MVRIFSFGGVSGANFNLAVTRGLFLSNIIGNPYLKDINVAQTGAYKTIQLLAGLCAALAAGGLYDFAPFGPGSDSNIITGAIPQGTGSIPYLWSAQDDFPSRMAANLLAGPLQLQAHLHRP